MKFGLLLSALFLAVAPVVAAEYPLRAEFPTVKPVFTDELAINYDKYIIVDVRGKFEYNTVHVTKALNISVTQATFLADLDKAMGGDKTKKIAFYCNGETCEKSYEASEKAAKAGYVNTFVYDAGIFTWLESFPEKTTFLGKSPADKSKIIPKAKFAEKCLAKADFITKAAGSDAMLIDTRDPAMRGENMPDWAKKSVNYTMDKFAANLDNPQFKQSTQGKTLYIFDFVGKQVSWLQYHLVEKGYTNYYFLKGGIDSK